MGGSITYVNEQTFGGGEGGGGEGQEWGQGKRHKGEVGGGVRMWWDRGVWHEAVSWLLGCPKKITQQSTGLWHGEGGRGGEGRKGGGGDEVRGGVRLVVVIKNHPNFQSPHNQTHTEGRGGGREGVGEGVRERGQMKGGSL